MASHTPAWKWVVALVVMAIGAGIAVPLGRYAENDDAPGGVMIAFLIFVVSAVVATRIVYQRPESSAQK